MKYFYLFILLFFCKITFSQHNFLGKSQSFITSFYNFDPEYTVGYDTINEKKLMVTCKTSQPYPYYTYEIDRTRDICISYGFISKDPQILDAYIDILDHVGELIEKDSALTTFVYKVSHGRNVTYYTIKQPFINTQYVSRRNIFYILVSDEKKETTQK